jgi:DNA-binding beta-propeller fold protein YncE
LRRLLAILAAWLTASACWVAVADPGSAPPARLRRPVDAVFLRDGQTLCVANQRSGTLSLVDLSGPRLRGEVDVGQRLTGLAVLPDHKHVLAADDGRHELIALSADGRRLTVRARLAVGPYPVSVTVLPDGGRAMVASLWSRRVEVVDLAPLSSPDRPTLRVLHTVRLPFAPRLQLALPGKSQVVIADSFGGHLAVVDASAGRLVAVHELNGHNLRGLALSADGKRLLIAHQILDQKAPTTRENVERGSLMSNVLRAIPLDALLDPRADLNKVSRVTRLDFTGAGAADPAGTAVLDDGQVAVALAGANEVALIPADGKQPRRIAVGCRPTALVAGNGGRSLVVLNTFDDSLSLLDASRGTVLHTISLGPQPKLSYQDRGEILFHDARLSRGATMSCHSCHTDGHTNGLLADTLGDNTFGTPKRTLTLLGTRLTDPWGWNGEVKYLHDQVRKSLAETMHTPTIGEDQVGDLTSFLSTLPPPPPPEPVTTDRADREQVERGRRVFEAKGCGRCHIPPLTYSSGGVYDVGFADEKGLRKFNPPSLRGVGQGYRFLHDGRAATLEEVFTKYEHKVGSDTPDSDVEDLLRFLRSL